MAQTVAYVQEHGFQSKEDLDTALSNASAQSTDARNTLKSTDDSLKSINEQIHYTGQYLANKSIYFDYRNSRNKEKFYEELNNIKDFPYLTPNGNFEGYFYPETYNFSEYFEEKDIIETIL